MFVLRRSVTAFSSRLGAQEPMQHISFRWKVLSTKFADMIMIFYHAEFHVSSRNGSQLTTNAKLIFRTIVNKKYTFFKYLPH
jgi:hypothetical protein